ncbi:VanZ family protein [Actinoplanes sp. CA-142083]|uniref:VanZ family protein n=1 Tax=Actinoplanes sp. CA-142083 TaxID=3239903 RepID=UPI003D8B3003
MRRFATPLFLVYVLGVLALTIAPDFKPDPTDYWGHEIWVPLQLTPFAVDAPSFLLNVVMFVPFGMLLPLCLPRVGSFWRILACSFAASLGIEVAQLTIDLMVHGHRTADVNDLVANVVGGVLGLGLLRLVRPGRPHSRP